jgi:hypothetical protein
MVKYTHKRSQHKRSQHKHKRSQHKRTHKQTGGKRSSRTTSAAEFYIKGAEYLTSKELVAKFIEGMFIPYLNHKKITSKEMNNIYGKVIDILNPTRSTANPISKYLLDYTTHTGKEWVYQYNPYKDTPLNLDLKTPSPIHEIPASQETKASLVRRLEKATKGPTIYGNKSHRSLLINYFPTPSPNYIPSPTRKRKSKKSPEEREHTPHLKILEGSPLNLESSTDPVFTNIEFKTPRDSRKKMLRYARNVLPPHDV